MRKALLALAVLTAAAADGQGAQPRGLTLPRSGQWELPTAAKWEVPTGQGVI
jgi:hypothetical protein